MALAQPGDRISADLASTRGSASFVDTIGVNVHLAYAQTSYADTGRVARSLEYLGVDNMRDAAPASWTSDIYSKFAAAGYDFDFFIPVRNGTTPMAESLAEISALEKAHPGTVIGIEGPNEINNWPAPWKGASDVASGARLQADLFAAVNADPTLRNVPVAALTVAGVDLGAMGPLGDISKSVDLGNVHVYFQNDGMPQSSWTKTIEIAKAHVGNHPFIVSETGFGSVPDKALGVSETVQAKQILNVLANAAEQGVERTYLYQLMDETAKGVGDGFNTFGLFEEDGSPKIAAVALHNLTSVLADDGDPAVRDPGTLDYVLKGLPSTAHRMLLTEADGTVDLVVWNEQPLWDRAASRERPVQTWTGTLEIGSAADLAVYDPMRGASAVGRSEDATTISFQLSDHPVVIEISGRHATSPVPGGGGSQPTPVPPVGSAPSPSVPVPPSSPSGDDVFAARAGNDRIDAGVGRDVFDASATGRGIVVDLARGTSSGTETGRDVLKNFEDVRLGSGNDRGSGDDRANRISGGAGDDVLLGRGGRDVLDGGTGRDQVSGGAGDDVVLTSAGDDVLSGGSGRDVLDASSTTRGVRIDLSRTSGAVVGSETGTDRASGFEGAIGGSGSDRLTGGRGGDGLSGGPGDDFLTGGRGDDVFSFSKGWGRDVVTDFDPGHDVLAIDAALLGGRDASSFARQVGHDVVLSFGADVLVLQNADIGDFHASDWHGTA